MSMLHQNVFELSLDFDQENLVFYLTKVSLNKENKLSAYSKSKSEMVELH